MKDAGIGSEHRSRKSMTDERDPVAAGLIVIGCDSAAKLRSGLKGGKEIAIDTRHADTLRLSLRREI